MQDETRSRLEPRLSPIAPLIYRFILDDNRPIFGQRQPPVRPAAQRAQETGVIWIAAPRRAVCCGCYRRPDGCHQGTRQTHQVHQSAGRRNNWAYLIQCAHGRPGRCTLELLQRVSSRRLSSSLLCSRKTTRKFRLRVWFQGKLQGNSVWGGGRIYVLQGLVSSGLGLLERGIRACVVLNVLGSNPNLTINFMSVHSSSQRVGSLS